MKASARIATVSGSAWSSAADHASARSSIQFTSDAQPAGRGVGRCDSTSHRKPDPIPPAYLVIIGLQRPLLLLETVTDGPVSHAFRTRLNRNRKLQWREMRYVSPPVTALGKRVVTKIAI